MNILVSEIKSMIPQTSDSISDIIVVILEYFRLMMNVVPNDRRIDIIMSLEAILFIVIAFGASCSNLIHGLNAENGLGSILIEHNWKERPFDINDAIDCLNNLDRNNKFISCIFNKTKKWTSFFLSNIRKQLLDLSLMREVINNPWLLESDIPLLMHQGMQNFAQNRCQRIFIDYHSVFHMKLVSCNTYSKMLFNILHSVANIQTTCLPIDVYLQTEQVIEWFCKHE
jgi:hypothetical protein